MLREHSCKTDSGPLTEGRLRRALDRAYRTRNSFALGDTSDDVLNDPGDGEDPEIVATFVAGRVAPETYEVHVSCDVDSGCHIVAVVPDDQGQGPDALIAEAIAMMGRDVIDLVRALLKARTRLGEIDRHASEAGNMFNVPIEEVTPEQRSALKATLFGARYGGGE